MAGITLQLAQDMLTKWLEADASVKMGQKYEIAGRELTRVDAAVITNKINFWNNYCKRLSRGGGLRVQRAMPVDL